MRNGGLSCPNPPVFRSFVNLAYCSRPFAVSAVAFGLEHNEVARSESFVVAGTPTSTFPAIACEISDCASDTRRKPCSTALFAAAVTTQT
jgi:hypothetical protein